MDRPQGIVVLHPEFIKQHGWVLSILQHCWMTKRTIGLECNFHQGTIGVINEKKRWTNDNAEEFLK